ncbi:MAG: hypothetical protein WB579_23940 [Bryobacteraceae bacterium]
MFSLNHKPWVKAEFCKEHAEKVRRKYLRPPMNADNPIPFDPSSSAAENALPGFLERALFTE